MAVTLPDTAATGDAGHVTDHNLLVAAVTDLQAFALPLRGTATTARESHPRWFSANLAMAGTGVMMATAVPVLAGDVVTSVSFVAATTGLTVGSNHDGYIWFALYDSAYGFIRQTSVESGAVAWSGTTAKTLNLTSTYTVPTTGIVYAAVMVNYGTGGSPVMPTLRGTGALNSPLSQGVVAGHARTSWQNGSGLTTTAPAGTVTPSTQGSVLYALLT